MTNEERQQAIEWLKRRPVMMAGAKRMYDLAIEALEAYVPDTNVGDMISRQAAIEALRTCYDTEAITYTNGNEYIDYDQALDLINTLPPVQPEIIRCRDCYWWTKQPNSLQGRCALSGTYPTGAFFCGNARKRGVEDGND